MSNENETVELVDGRLARLTTERDGAPDPDAVLQVARKPGPCDWSDGSWCHVRPKDQQAILATLQAHQQQQIESSDVLIAELRVALRSTLEMMGRHDVECEALMGRSCSCGRDAANELLRSMDSTASARAPQQWVACAERVANLENVCRALIEMVQEDPDSETRLLDVYHRAQEVMGQGD